MNLPLFIARRIYHQDGHQQEVSRPAIRIATLGVAIGLAVMIVTVSVVFGFKHTIRDKVAGFGSHIQIGNFMTQQTGLPFPICISDTLADSLRSLPNVRHLQTYVQAQGILKTDSDFLGVVFKGIAADYDTTFLSSCMMAGRMPNLNDSTTSKYELLISQTMANQLNLSIGTRVFAYFLGNDDLRMRRFTVCGIYQTNMKQFDDVICFTHFRIPLRLNNWEADQSNGVELLVSDFTQLPQTAEHVIDMVNRQTDRYGETLTSQTIYEAYPQVFSWLSLLDINVWIILALMVCVAGFTMISGLLIIILERTQMIGVLKALGARNATIRRTFLWFAVFIIGRGLLLGDVLGIGLVVLQQQFGLVHLDPASYYVETAPVELNIAIVLLLNLATLLISIFVLIAPSYLVSHIHPARSMRYE
jgi:lipoprotein-releasing system permease protein